LEAAEQFLVEGGHGPRAIDADQPVAFRTAGGGLAQRNHLRVAAQVGEALADGVGSHRLQPEALDRLLVFEVLDDVAENEFAFAAGVAGVDDLLDVGAGQEFFQDAQLVLSLLPRDESEMVGKDRKILEGPLAADHFEAVGLLDLEEMAHRMRDDHVIAFVVAFFFFEFAEGLGEIAGHAGFFRNDEGFGHLQTSFT